MREPKEMNRYEIKGLEIHAAEIYKEIYDMELDISSISYNDKKLHLDDNNAYRSVIGRLVAFYMNDGNDMVWQTSDIVDNYSYWLFDVNKWLNDVFPFNKI